MTQSQVVVSTDFQNPLMQLEVYSEQSARWPDHGRVILANYDEESITVYQAYRPEIGEYAVKHQRFGGPFKMTRMTWIKPNFLWMMYRSGWGRKEGQEVTLAVRLRRSAFDEVLAQAVPSSFVPELYADRDAWSAAVAHSDVRLQWDPDHDPSGQNVERRAIQLGLRGAAVQKYASDWIVRIDDVSDLVAEQREFALARDWESLRTPREEPYPVTDADIASRLGLEPPT